MQKVSQEEIIKFCHKNSVIDFLKVDVVPTDDGKVRLELFVEEQHTNPYGMLHGGVMTTMLDTAMGAECFARRKVVVTVSMTIEFMKPVPLHTKIITDAKIFHDGKQILMCEGKLIDESGELYAKADATFFAIRTFEGKEEK